MKLLRESLGFTAVGGMQLLLDWGVMIAFSSIGLPLPIANVSGRAAGACLGFWANRQVTFGGKGHPFAPQALRFLILWAVLTLLSTLAMEFVANHSSLTGAWLLKPLIEAALSVISFFTCRYWVYR